MLDKIKKWYKQGLWTEIMVKNAIKKGVLSQFEGEMLFDQAKEDA